MQMFRYRARGPGHKETPFVCTGGLFSGMLFQTPSSSKNWSVFMSISCLFQPNKLNQNVIIMC